MTSDERLSAVARFGFTERQARFLVLVMRHAGVCVRRQYAAFAGVANGGRKTNAFFDNLERDGYAVGCDCVHNRGRVYHVRHQPLYRAIGEPDSRYRRPVPAGRVVHRLTLLDAVVASPGLAWLTTQAEKLTRFPAMTSAEARTGFPIGLDSDGRVILLYAAMVPSPSDLRRFVRGHLETLRTAPAWTIRLVFPRRQERLSRVYRAVIHDAVETPSFTKPFEAGLARVEMVVLPHTYRHLTPLPGAPSCVRWGLRTGEEPGGKRPARGLNPSLRIPTTSHWDVAEPSGTETSSSTLPDVAETCGPHVGVHGAAFSAAPDCGSERYWGGTKA